MKILFDCIGSPPGSGGVEVWARETLRGWSQNFPEDKLIVVGHPSLFKVLPKFNGETIPIAATSQITRGLAQLVAVPLIFFFRGATHLLSFNAVLSPALWSTSTVVFNHDWRHLKKTQEFPGLQRLFRLSWIWSTKKSKSVVAVSAKTAEETSRFTGRTDTIVITPGADHLGAIKGETSLSAGLAPRHFFLTYGHHNNKRPELAMEGFARLKSFSNVNFEDLQLVILGVENVELRQSLLHLSRLSGVIDQVRVFPFVSSSDYSWLVRNAAAVLLLSTDEGYGIPVAEAQYFGTPVIVSRQSGLADLVHAGVLSVGDDLNEIAEALQSMLQVTRKKPEKVWTWSEVVVKLRALVLNPRGKRV